MFPAKLQELLKPVVQLMHDMYLQFVLLKLDVIKIVCWCFLFCDL